MIVAVRSVLMGWGAGLFMLFAVAAPDWAAVQTALLVTCVFLTVPERE